MPVALEWSVHTEFHYLKNPIMLSINANIFGYVLCKHLRKNMVPSSDVPITHPFFMYISHVRRCHVRRL